MGDDRPIRYLDTIDGTESIIWRASSLGACDRALVACALGLPAAPKPQWFQDILDEGSEMESQINAKWEAESGHKTTSDQFEVELYLGDIGETPVYVRGHIDGMTAHHGERILREYKKARESTFDKFCASGVDHLPSYPWQVSTYMLGIGASRCEFVIGLCLFDEHGDPYIDKVHCVEVPEPPHSLKEIRKRVMRVERQIAAGFDALEIDCAAAMYPCPYYRLHDVEDMYDLDDEVAEKWADILVVADRELARLRALSKVQDQTKRDAAEELRKILAARDADNEKKIVVGGAQLTRVKQHVPERMTKPYDMDYFTVKKVDG